jgi:hypothetical protein
METQIVGSQTCVLGYHKYTIKASFASLYIGNLQENEIINHQAAKFPKCNHLKPKSKNSHYHDMKLSPVVQTIAAGNGVR